jgi:uncharacterized protein (DUF433 family)
MFERITFDPKIMGGRGQITHGATIEEVLSDYPDLEQEDIKQALEYAAWLAQEEVYPV